MTSFAPASACGALALAVAVLPTHPAALRLASLGRSASRPAAARVLPAAVVVAAGALTGLLVLGPAGALAGGAGALAWRRRQERARRDRTIAATTVALTDALGRIAEELRAGAHPATALRGVAADAGPARALLGPAATAAGLGDSVGAALTTEAERRPEVAHHLRHVAGAWALAEQYGVPPADLLAGVHADLRWRVAYAGRVSAALAGPRATAAVLTGLPVLGILLGELIGAAPLQVLRSGVLGQVLLLGGVVLAAAGAAWAGAIVRSAVPR